jgi:hypothetical protein
MSFPVAVRPRRAIWLATLLALAAAAAVVLILSLDGGSSKDAATVSAKAQPSLRADRGPEETGVAAAVGSRPSAGPDESRTAASVGHSSPQSAIGPDAIRAGAAAGTSSTTGSGPDESRIAAAISGR